MTSNSEKKSIKVGVFGDNPDAKAPVPKPMLNKQIWYSNVHKQFMIVDESHKPMKAFGFEQYKKFVDACVIVYTNDSIHAYMNEVLRQWLEANDARDSEILDDGNDYSEYAGDYDDGDLAYDDDQSYNDDYDDQYNNGVTNDVTQQAFYNRRDASLAMDGGSDLNEALKVKDPTRHLGAFFSTTMLIALAIVIVLNFGKPILDSIAPLLS